jgi:putative SOS response-associated peptidase YedK
MCGRITFRASGQVVVDLFQLIEAQAPALTPRYNVAPTQPLLAVREAANGTGRGFVTLRWGLIPHWADDPKIGYRLINARAETVATKPSFRSAFRSRRCLVPADGYYEWQKLGKAKQPFYFHRKDDRPFAFAGLWERWESQEGELVESCTILTTTANEVARPVHDRMPVIVDPPDFGLWLDPAGKLEQCQALLRPYSGEGMEAYAATSFVNSPGHQGLQCIERVA